MSDTGSVGQLAHAAAAHALRAGLTRSEFMALVGFMWGQAASDYAALVAKAALDAGEIDDSADKEGS